MGSTGKNIEVINWARNLSTAMAPSWGRTRFISLFPGRSWTLEISARVKTLGRMKSMPPPSSHLRKKRSLFRPSTSLKKKSKTWQWVGLSLVNKQGLKLGPRAGPGIRAELFCRFRLRRDKGG